MANDFLIDVFEDTRQWYQSDAELIASVKNSIAETRFYKPEEYPDFSREKRFDTEICVSKKRSFQAAMDIKNRLPQIKIAVQNFASATNAGGGVKSGSRAQEESLCRCSTLYPVLNTPELWDKFYQMHRDRHDMRYTDSCIYSPDIKIIKTDTNSPARMRREDWCSVDIITCAAPNLRENNSRFSHHAKTVKLTESELIELHKKRMRHMFVIAAANKAEALVLGAFGCGVFQNPPLTVAKAFKEIVDEFDGVFRLIEFAVYSTPNDSKNHDAFRIIFG